MSNPPEDRMPPAEDRETPFHRAIRYLWLATSNSELPKRRCGTPTIPCLQTEPTLVDFERLRTALEAVPVKLPAQFVTAINLMRANPAPVALARVQGALLEVDVFLWSMELDDKLGAIAEPDRSDHVIKRRPLTLDDIWTAARAAQDGIQTAAQDGTVNVAIARELFERLGEVATVLDPPESYRLALVHLNLCILRNEVRTDADRLLKGLMALEAAILVKEQES
ncbi:MAG TPA: hypothetical protein VHQ86_02490 [Candidatus Saccharimonadia bacterium]|jgi:hypothetical protein|nr:hypothetical protein [Candidatus Saccharimonadia bacterium]